MLDPKFIRENIDLVRDAIQKKRLKTDLDKFLELDNQKRELQKKFEEKRAEQNKISKEIAQASAEEREEKIKSVSLLKEEIQKIEAELKPVEKE